MMAATSSNKADRLAALAQLRRHPDAGTCRDGYSRDYRRIEEFHNRSYDQHNWVSPLAITAHNVESDLMIIGQDWAGQRYLTRRGDPDRLRLGYDETLKTNKTLAKLLDEAFRRNFRDVFATNSFVFIKPGGMSGSIPVRDLRLSARTYTLQEIGIVRPKMAICLGTAAFNALRSLRGLHFQQMKDANYVTPELMIEGTEVYGVPHTGVFGQRFTGEYEASLAIWRKLADRLARL